MVLSLDAPPPLLYLNPGTEKSVNSNCNFLLLRNWRNLLFIESLWLFAFTARKEKVRKKRKFYFFLQK